MVQDQVSGAKVTGSVTNPGDFEVTVNGQLIYSKHQTGCFPDPNAVSGLPLWKCFHFVLFPLWPRICLTSMWREGEYSARRAHHIWPIKY